jgi:2'-5' RNA ligase
MAMTTVLVPLRFADAAVRAVRDEHDWSARRGVGAHITLLGPFLPPERVTGAVVERLRGLLAGFRPLELTLGELHRRGTSAWLVPHPSEPLRALSALLADAWPEAPGRQADHHVTLARGCDEELFAAIAEQLAPALPLRGRATEAHVLHRRVDRVVERLARLPLGAAA